MNFHLLTINQTIDLMRNGQVVFTKMRYVKNGTRVAAEHYFYRIENDLIAN